MQNSSSEAASRGAQVLRDPAARNEFLRQMLRFTQHPDLQVSGIALQMWNTVMNRVRAHLPTGRPWLPS